MFVWGRNARAHCGSLVSTSKCLERLPGIEGSQCSDSLGIHRTTNARYFYQVWGQSEQSAGVSGRCVLGVGWVVWLRWLSHAQPVGPALRLIRLWALSCPSAHICACCCACGASMHDIRCHPMWQGRSGNTKPHWGQHLCKSEMPAHILRGLR